MTEQPDDLALLAAKANVIRRRLDLSLKQEWRQMLEAEARWLGPMQGPIKTFAPGVGWTRNLLVPLGRRARFDLELRNTAARVGLYALCALMCIGVAWLVEH